jgi:hypothetical protein
MAPKSEILLHRNRTCVFKGARLYVASVATGGPFEESRAGSSESLRPIGTCRARLARE